MTRIFFTSVCSILLCSAVAATSLKSYIRIESKKALTIMPNHKTGDAQIIFFTTKNRKATVTVTDESGKAVRTLERNLTTGKNHINIDSIADLAEGTYRVELITLNKMYAAVFIVWK